MIEFDAIIDEEPEPVWEHPSIIAYLIRRRKGSIKAYKRLSEHPFDKGSKQHFAIMNYYQQEVALWDFLIKLVGTLDAGLKLKYGRATISSIIGDSERDNKKPSRTS